MSRGLDAAIEAAFGGKYLRPIAFVELQFDVGTEYLHDHIGAITWNSQTWTGVGELGRIDPIEEAEDGTPHGMQLSLSGLDATFVAETLQNDYFGRPVILYLSALDTDGSLVATPDEVWRGKIDIMEGNLGGEIVLVAESEDADFQRENGELFSDAQLQADFPGDLLLEFAEQMRDARVLWGSGNSVRFGAANGRLTFDADSIRRTIGNIVGIG